ncbi:2,4-dihydroxyhept-2-ene-1,7-dioic acid aldolase [Lacihabitans sp. LS3-19]|uniref:HpcH/HpaI aldolase family protein n=1 Tax=Lacihabitans sp. LS3-19 TaxID=2487335 RepID=UPI0020CF0C04|nr:aldolase/citrate lyase family protein [Lacihabitans sp. LS3-19]MCP9766618.1 2,4-dihydroxyhept-2-ene-1,7-dioic acid aldolase [Lacihabitans sp. LS3-19]
MKNKIKEKWAKGEAVSNAWISIPNAWTAEIMASVGYDVMTIDAQHGLAADLANILPMLQAIEGSGTVPFVRLPDNNPAFIMRMLDAGVVGLICPMLEGVEDTAAFIKAAKYYPKGNRSLGPTRSNVVYGENYAKEANDFTITLAMIETPEALKNIRNIAKIPDLDGFYVGPWDLSMSLGYEKLADFQDPSFLKILKEILDVANEHNLVTGIHAATPENARFFADMGYKFVTMINDSSALKTIAKSTLANFEGSGKNGELGAY